MHSDLRSQVLKLVGFFLRNCIKITENVQRTGMVINDTFSSHCRTFSERVRQFTIANRQLLCSCVFFCRQYMLSAPMISQIGTKFLWQFRNFRSELVKENTKVQINNECRLTVFVLFEQLNFFLQELC